MTRQETIVLKILLVVGLIEKKGEGRLVWEQWILNTIKRLVGLFNPLGVPSSLPDFGCLPRPRHLDMKKLPPAYGHTWLDCPKKKRKRKHVESLTILYGSPNEDWFANRAFTMISIYENIKVK